MMKVIFTLTFLFVANFGLCQDLQVSANNVNKLFKSSISQSSKKTISIGSGEWQICNQDSAFFKSDTLLLYDNLNYFYQSGKCCNFIGWTFYKTSAFIQSKSQICNEPSSRSTRTEFYAIKVVDKQNSTYLLISKKGTLAKKFKVIGITKVALADDNFSNVITIKRTK